MKDKDKINRRAERKQYIFALRQLVTREVKRKYARSYLGIVWSVLNPLLFMAVMSMIFSTIFKHNIENFPIYYLTGLIMWQLFNNATNSAMSLLVDNRNLLQRVKLSKQTFVLSRMYAALVNFLYTCIAYVLMLILFKIEPSFYMLLFPVPVFFLLLFSMGIGYILSVVYVFFPDIQHLYSVILTLWMNMSALFYPIENLRPAMKVVVQNNPIHAYVAFARDVVMYAKLPEPLDWVRVVGWGLLIFIAGYCVFKKYDNKVMEKV